MKYGVFSSNEWLFPDSVTETGLLSASVTLLKGQTGAFQLLIADLPLGESIRWDAVGFENIDFTVSRGVEVCVNRNTNNMQSGALTTDCWEDVCRDRVRQAPYRTYDALLPAQKICTEKQQELYYITVLPSVTAADGVQNGKLVLCFGEEAVEIPLSIRVCKKQLPASTLQLTNWMSIDGVANHHGTEYGSPEHIAVLKKYIGSMVAAHQNIFCISFADMKVTQKDGKYHFDFSGIKRWADLALSCGIKRLEWSPILSRPAWSDPPFQVKDLTTGKEWNCLATYGRKYLTAFLAQFYEFLRENGWCEISLVHINDEPLERCATDYRIIAGIFRKYLPGVKLIEATEIYFLEDALDIYVPKNYYYQMNKRMFEYLRDERNELWFYTCNVPGGKFLNRLMDAPLLNTRLLHWGNYRYDLKGYLHWAYFQVGKEQDPFEETSAETFLPAGDTHLVYPGKGGPLLSLRYYQMKAGVEDYEILHALAAIDKAKADEICHRVLRTFDDYITDVAAFEKIQEELILAFDEA